MLGVFVNTLTADDKYSKHPLQNCPLQNILENLSLPIQMQLS